MYYIESPLRFDWVETGKSSHGQWFKDFKDILAISLCAPTVSADNDKFYTEFELLITFLRNMTWSQSKDTGIRE